MTVTSLVLIVLLTELAATLRGSRPWGAIRIAHYDVIDDVITPKL